MDSKAPKRLYRSMHDRWISGVCGGVAEYFRIDSTIVRILWVVFTITGGVGILLYIAAMIIIPLETTGEIAVKRKGTDNKMFWGILLLALGLIFLLQSFHWRFWAWYGIDFWRFVIPLVIIALGVFLIFKPPPPQLDNMEKKAAEEKSAKEESTEEDRQETRRLYRSRSRVLAGVAGGTAEYFGIDPGLCRLLWVLMILLSGGLGLLIYIILAFTLSEVPAEIIPEEGKND